MMRIGPDMYEKMRYVTSVRRILATEGLKLRAIRLAALKESPTAFGSSLERELRFSDELWSARATESASGFVVGTFIVTASDDEPWQGLVTVLGPEHEARSSGSSTETGAVLVSMWVAPLVRGLGWGCQLLDASVKFARSMDVSAIDLSVTHGNIPATALYEQYGFVRVNDGISPCEGELHLRFVL